ncbi:hypothetical protein STEG23_031955 [Scotinomys teguina]
MVCEGHSLTFNWAKIQTLKSPHTAIEDCFGVLGEQNGGGGGHNSAAFWEQKKKIEITNLKGNIKDLGDKATWTP